MKKIVQVLLILVAVQSFGQKKKENSTPRKTDYSVPLTPEKWTFQEGKVTFADYKGQKAMKIAPASGMVELKDVVFKDGTIEYGYFDYSVTEALFLSDKEEMTVSGIIQSIQQEYHSNIDKFSQDLVIAQLELLLKYSERFYQRQFITRKISNHNILDRLESILSDYFNGDDVMEKGLPTVQYIADTLNISPTYLSNMLKLHTGQTTQQHIHEKLIEKAKEKLSITDLSISEIAYALGFEHPQSFSKLFKTKTNFSPLEFRQSFN